jgi:DNA-binding LacI/PurR family transcriptional regulator
MAVQGRKSEGPRPATLRDIAQRVGVSRMAVSAVLSGTTSRIGVSSSTRDRIVSAAQEMQYRPNAVARSLRRRRTDAIGFYSGYHYLDPRNPFIGAILGGLQEGCAAFGKDLLLHSDSRGTTPDDVDDIYGSLVDGRIDGLVLFTPPEDPLVERLAVSHVPVVAVADVVASLPSVGVDDETGARLTFDHLLARGHRRFLYRSRQGRLVSAERRREAFLGAAAARSLPMEEWCGPQCGGADDLVRAWLDHHAAERPTAILCWNDDAAYDLLEACHRFGVRVPEDLAVTGFDAIPNPTSFRWRLTTIRAPWSEAARTAVDLLITQIEGTVPPRETILPVEFVAGDSA